MSLGLPMKLPRNFYRPLATGAPAPWRELLAQLERMIHFVPPHNEKLRAKVPELIKEVDVVLGNLEDAIPESSSPHARDSSSWRAPTISARPACGRASTR
jgi:malyl-CoA/(S)-citramalyl-CoA lyase